jgi:hypothetical protein
MWICPACSRVLDHDAKTCPDCGQAIQRRDDISRSRSLPPKPPESDSSPLPDLRYAWNKRAVEVGFLFGWCVTFLPGLPMIFEGDDRFGVFLLLASPLSAVTFAIFFGHLADLLQAGWHYFGGHAPPAKRASIDKEAPLVVAPPPSRTGEVVAYLFIVFAAMAVFAVNHWYNSPYDDLLTLFEGAIFLGLPLGVPPRHPHRSPVASMASPATSGIKVYTMRILLTLTLLLLAILPVRADDAPWLKGQTWKLPTEYTNQESGYFSIIAGLNDKLYIGTAKYGINAYLLEFDPKSEKTRLVMDVHDVIKLAGKGFAAQSKIHTRNNVGESGLIYVGSKQGYPEKGEHVCDYPGGYVLTHDPKTGKNEHYGIAKARHGIISVTPDESRGVAYVSTCSDERPIDHTHFMILNLKTRTYRDLGDMQHMYAFIVVDHLGRAYHPVRGGTIARYDPNTDKVDRLSITIDGSAPSKAFTKDDCILNWDLSPDRKTLFAVEMTTNGLYSFDLTAPGKTIPGKRLGDLLTPGKGGKTRQTDCRAMCVGPDGTVWAAITEQGLPGGAQLHLISHRPGTKAPRDHGKVGVANPTFTTFNDAAGKPKPWHHAMRKEKDGTLTPWVPMGVCATKDGSVYVYTISPLVLIRYTKEQVK